jgi:polo-like kinase 1
VWALGIIMYTLLVGKPPFETLDVKTTYKNIQDGNYEWPADVVVSAQAKDLITRLLFRNPAKRPVLDEIIIHDFFTKNKIPKILNASTLTEMPTSKFI